MPTLSADQLTAVAQAFHDLGVAVGQFRLDRIHDGEPLDDPRIVQLFGQQFSLLNASSTFALQAAQVHLADADTAAAAIRSATDQANAAIENTAAINKVVTIAAASIVLAAAVFTGDMGQIFTAAGGVKTAITG